MKKFAVILSLLFVCMAVQADDISQLKEKFRSSILYTNDFEQKIKTVLLQYEAEDEVGDQMIVELMDRYQIEEAYIEDLITKMLPSGTWADIDFTDKNAPGWTPKNHASRVLDLTRVYSNPNHSMYLSQNVENAIRKAMNFWFDKMPVAGNWWYNQIGIPKTLGAAFMLFENQMNEDEIAKAIVVMNNSKISMTAQNRVWLAGNVLVRGMLLNDAALIQEARDAINSEIKIAYGKAEGIKVDQSFHQHGPQQQYGNYGAAYLATMGFWAYILDDTAYALDAEKFGILSDLTNLGFRRILWKGYMDVNCMGRQFYVNAQRHKAFSMMFSANALEQSDAAHAPQYAELIDENLKKEEVGLQGNYHFWKSDMTVQREPTWMTSLKMSSDRVIGTEGGSENIKGYYVADGALYTYVQGNEYENIFPNWDWTKIPGVTNPNTGKPWPAWKWLDKQNLGAFVGNVNDGKYGLTSMELYRDSLTGRKAWFFTPNYVLCLGAGISYDEKYPVTTTVEQALRREDFKVLKKKKWMPIDSLAFEGKDNRFFHKNIGYVLLNAKGVAKVNNRTNSWNEIMRLYPKTMIETNDVYTLYIDHGVGPKNASYQYVVLPDVTPSEVRKFDNSSYKLIENSESLQAIRLADGTYAIAMYKADAISLDNDLQFSSDKPALFLIKKNRGSWIVDAADPTQRLSKLSIKLNGKIMDISLPADEYRGKSVTVKIN